jgi:hypothetical protein
MTRIRVQLVRVDSTTLPAIVEFRLSDSFGTVHQFVDKDVVFLERIDREGALPLYAHIGCERLGEEGALVRIKLACSVISNDDIDEFLVHPSQLSTP